MSKELIQIEDKVVELGKALESLPQIPLPVTHKFAPGVYYREIFMPAGTFIIGHKHTTTHFNIVLLGRALVLMDGVVHEISAPQSFVSNAGVRKVLHILEDMVWATIHQTTETDVTKLEETLVDKTSIMSVTDHELQLLGRIK